MIRQVSQFSRRLFGGRWGRWTPPDGLCRGRAPGGFWSVRVAVEADWPQQSRLLEVFDNHDGTLSIFGTILDHAVQLAAPPAHPHGQAY